MPRSHLPIIPTRALRRHGVHEPIDTRFRSCCRLLQSLWRHGKGLPAGNYTRRDNATVRLGSMISERAGEAGRNFLLPEVARLARREVAYREVGALIEERRLWCNLLSSMPMCLNVLGPLKLDKKLGTRMLRAMFADMADATLEAVKFEHSPGRGLPNFTGDNTAFDALLVYVRANGTRGFVAVETKYSEDLGAPSRPLSPRYGELSALAALHHNHHAEELSNGRLQQFYRQHLLAQALLMQDDFSEGRLLVIAPALNAPVQRGIRLYASKLVPPSDAQVSFSAISLEEILSLFGECGERGYAKMLFERYLDWEKIDHVIDLEISAFALPAAAKNDNTVDSAAA